MGERNMEVSSVPERSGTSVVDEGCQTSAEIWDVVSSGQQTKSLLELAADNDLEAFKRVVEQNHGKLVGSETWYLRQTGSNQMASEERTPCMIASLYGSLEVLCYILSNPGLHDSHVNGAYGSDQSTALHCAAAGGSPRAVEIVKMLLRRGANKDAVDASGRRPGEVIQVPPKFPHVKMALETMLNGLTLEKSLVHVADLDGTSNGKLHAPSLSKEEEDFAPTKDDSLLSAPSACSTPDSSPQFSPQFPSSPKYQEMHSVKCYGEGIDKIRDYPADPSIPDIKSSAYTTDEFRMFSFKVRPCSRAYSHDWTECPFVHPGENARRRDPRRYHYSCVPCPDFRKGACRRGDACEYAHGVFECWLHPAQYRTRLCKDGTSCARRVCFFAHTTEELRPLYVAMGSSVPSPRATSPMGSRSISPPLPPGSPAPMLVVPPYSPSAPGNGLATPPLSPSSLSTWSQASVPSLHLSGGSLHVSRLRAALSARDITLEEYSRNSDYDGNLASEFSPRSSRSNSAVLAATGGNLSGRMNKFCNLGLSIPQTNLQDMFASEVVSPMGGVHQSSMSPQERTHLSSQMSQLQLQSQLSSLLSPLSPLSQLPSHAGVQMQNSSGMRCKSPVIFNAGSAHPIIAHRRDLDSPVSPCATLSPGTHTAILSQRDKSNWNCKNFVGSLPSPSWSDWGSPSGKPDWGVQGHDLGKFRKSASFASHGGVEPDLSWVHTLVREGQADMEPLVSSSSVASDRIEPC